MVNLTVKNFKPLMLVPGLRQMALAHLERSGEEIVGKIITKYYKGHEGGRRAQGWKSRVYKLGERRGMLEIRNDVPFAAIENPYRIVMNDKLLAIPQSPALKEDGTKKYPKGPMGYKMFQKGGSKELRPVMSKSGALLLMRVNPKTHKIVERRAYYRLVPIVEIKATTPGLTPFVMKEMEKAGRMTFSFFRKALA